MITRKNDEIIKSVLVESYSNITGGEIDTLCSKLPKGNNQDSCYDQLDGTRDSGKSDSITLAYWKAVVKGYEGTIEDFEKRRNTLVDLGTKAGGFLSGLFGSNEDVAPVIGSTAKDDKKGLSKGAKIGVAVGSVALISLIGFLIYKRNK